MEEKINHIEEARIIIDNLYQEYNKKEVALQIEIDSLQEKLDDIMINIKSFSTTVDSDYNVFSPRKVVSRNDNKVEKLYDDKDKIEKQIKQLNADMNIISHKSDQLMKVLKHLSSMETQNELKEKHVDECIVKHDNKYNDKHDEIKSTEKDNPASDHLTTGLSVIHHTLSDDLLRINNRIESCIKIINQDYVRVKIDLQSINKNIKDIITSLKN